MKGLPILLLFSSVIVATLVHCSPVSSEEQAAPSTEKVKIKLMTSLPIIWGEGDSMQDILSGDSSPAPIYKYWQKKYATEAVDSLEGLQDSDTDIVMLAQPRAMAPADLAELDDWVRAGGKAILFTDPSLHWPSEFPLGDIRRPLFSGLLSPLLQHWGLELVVQDEGTEPTHLSFEEYDIATIGVGRFAVLTGKQQGDVACKLNDAGFLAQCAIGKGQALLISDADFLDEQLWTEKSDWTDGDESEVMKFTSDLVDQIQ